MHRSRLSGFMIDCQGTDIDGSASFWGSALGMPAGGDDGNGYRPLDSSARDLRIEVQRVTHPSRLHLDIESEDVEAEVTRLEALGAMRIAKVRTWWLMEAPTGHRFCVVPSRRSLEGVAGANEWP